MTNAPMDSLTYLTGDLPGVGGKIKARNEDFMVEELPLYEPVGQGEHLYLYVQKTGQATMEVIRRIAKMFHVSKRDVGYAGLKDKRAITRQYFSVYLPDTSQDEKWLARFEFTPFKLLWSARHENKLRRGHLKGNRFVIYIRDVEPSSVVSAKRVLDRLIQTGVPNYFGPQRFGYRQCNHLLGKMLILKQWQPFIDKLLGDAVLSEGQSTHQGRLAYEAGDYLKALELWPRALRGERQLLDGLRQGRCAQEVTLGMDRQQLEYIVCSLQSHLFNQVLNQRVQANLLGQLVAGDLAWKHDNRSVFQVDPACADKENAPEGRVASFEVSPSGPMWGSTMIQPTGHVLAWETEALEAFGLSVAQFESVDHVHHTGCRRPMRIALSNTQISGGADEHGPYIKLVFDLPRGAFATTVLGELMKNPLTTTAQPDSANQASSIT